MNVLGLHYGHDASVAIVKDGKLVASISGERISRVKKSEVLTEREFEYAFKKAGITLDDIDAVALSNISPVNKQETISVYRGEEEILSIFNSHFMDDFEKIKCFVLGRELPLYIIPHQLSHAASAYYTSNMESSYVFTMDSSGGKIEGNSAIAIGRGNKLTTLNSPGMMIGNCYSSFTMWLGLGPAIHKAGSTMGLASYGKPNQDLIENIDLYIKESYFETLDYFKYYESLWDKWLPLCRTPYDMAASLQFLFEECLVDVINNKIPNDDINNLCLSGGSLLNCNANTKIKQNSRFKKIHHFPACGDDGIAAGAALYVAHHIYDEPRAFYKTKEICYMGQDYDYIEPDYKRIAQMIADGLIVGWFMGASEVGPRALGHRSILADPRNFHNREILNFKIKNREWFRPFAPSVLEEKAHEWFDFDGPSPFMLYTSKVLQPEKVPAITHIDGTARQQTVNKETNEPFYKLIQAFDEITRIPMVINTSLNGNGQPILETEEDAMDFFKNSLIDAMVINGKIITR